MAGHWQVAMIVENSHPLELLLQEDLTHTTTTYSKIKSASFYGINKLSRSFLNEALVNLTPNRGINYKNRKSSSSQVSISPVP
jgi:hypothetical protein